MRIRAWCKDCDLELAPTSDEPFAPLACEQCRRAYPLTPTDSLRQGVVDRCAVCGYEHLHRRKDFPRRLGLAIVLLAAILTFAPITPPGLFFLPLVAASIVDAALYLVIPWKVVCYVCEAEYRGARPLPSQKAFDLAEATERKRLRWPRPASSTPGGSAAPGA